MKQKYIAIFIALLLASFLFLFNNRNSSKEDIISNTNDNITELSEDVVIKQDEIDNTEQLELDVDTKEDTDTYEELKVLNNTGANPNYSYWVTFYDHDGNILQQDAIKYGTVPTYWSDTPYYEDGTNWYKGVGWTDAYGRDVTEFQPIKGNTRFYAKYEVGGAVSHSSSDSSTPVPTSSTSVSGLYQGGVLVKTWDELKADYPSAFSGNTIVSSGLNSYFASLSGDLVIDDSITEIGSYAFQNCNGITSIKTTGNIQIGYNAFSSCANLSSVDLCSVTSLDGGAFEGCTNLSNVTLYEGLTSIGMNCFRNTNFSSIVIPNTVTTISSSIFEDNSSLVSVTWPNTITNIPSGTFRDCTSLTSVNFSCDITSIGTYAFYGCSSLTSFNFANTLNSIGQYAFNSSGLQSIIIPDSVTSIGSNCFESCLSATTISVGNGISTISENAFNNCSYASNITIGSSVTLIKGWAFANCTAVSDIIIPDTVSTIQSLAFQSVPHITYNGSAPEVGMMVHWGAAARN